MKPIYQKGTHDCFRACVASVLNLNWLDVPDFFEDVPDGQYMDAVSRTRMDRWFTDRDLAYVEMSWTLEPDVLVREIGAMNSTATFIVMGCQLNGQGHACVARGGEIIHDPSSGRPSSVSLARPCGDGYTRAGFILVQSPD